ncbi:hypothetical protein [Microcoleus vaginatus]|uniref:hypothetical protein n=1 Tax=Microcoleus vaginatus TaxID=119532 RepID=UPI00403F0603
MPYSKFTLSKAVEAFDLTIVEGTRFLPEISPVTPSFFTAGYSQRNDALGNSSE